MTPPLRRFIVLVVALGFVALTSGCIDLGQEYSVSTGEPQTGDVFDEVVSAEIDNHWGPRGQVEVRYSVDQNWVGPDGNVTGPHGNWTDPPRIVKVQFVDGATEQSPFDQAPIRAGHHRWSGEFGVPDNSDTARYQIRAVAENEVLDAVNVTVSQE